MFLRLWQRRPTASRTRKPARTSRPRPSLEGLEERYVLSAFLVTNTNDGGTGSLRQAITAANSNPGRDVIQFNITGSGTQTIRLNSTLPTITDPVVLDATTQPGYAGKPLIQLDGSAAGFGANGLTITGGGSTVEGFVISNFGGDGILLQGGGGNVIQGNYIGTDATGSAAAGNGSSQSGGFFGGADEGIKVDNSADNIIGGTSAAARNVVAGNTGDGIQITGAGSTGNVVEGNYVGTNAAGTRALANGLSGVAVFSLASNNVVGTAGAGNLLSGNAADGLFLGFGSTGNQVLGNTIGTDVTGKSALANGSQGVEINNANGNTIGGTATGAGNLISANAQSGVYIWDGAAQNVLEGNLIGTDVTGTKILGNSSRGVSLDDASDNIVGGTDAGARNVVSGNFDGIWVTGSQATGNVIEGDYIGTNAAGTAALGNTYFGVRVEYAADNTIGGTAAGAGNVISGNDLAGVALIGSTSTGNLVRGNFIGTDLTGTAALGNGSRAGVTIEYAPGNTIGGATAGAGNLISRNATGVNIVGNTATGNLLQGNAIVANTGNGVNIAGATGTQVGGTGPGEGNVISGNHWDGILLDAGAGQTVIQGNLIGTDWTGTKAQGNSNDGIEVAGASGVVIGGGNVISGNVHGGVQIYGTTATGDVVQGNRIGTDASGENALGNGWWGLTLSGGATGNTVGTVGTGDPGQANVISANLSDGVLISDAGTSSNVVAGNFIGTDALGTRALGNAGNGVYIYHASNNTVGGTGTYDRNVISGNSHEGVSLYGSSNDLIEGNYVGTDVSGTKALGNSNYGVKMSGTSDTVGGTTAAARNLLSGNGIAGVGVFGSGNLVEGNYIGTDVTGTATVGNGLTGNTPGGNYLSGVDIEWATNNTVGGTAAGAGNLISGNFMGVLLEGTTATGNHIEGNWIGTDVTGTKALGNQRWGAGVLLYKSGGGNVVGGTAAGAGNVISGNAEGITVQELVSPGDPIEGNLIGTDPTGTMAVGNTYAGVNLAGANHAMIGGTAPGAGNVIAYNSYGVYLDSGNNNAILGNSIFANWQGIRFLDSSANNGQAAPVLGTATLVPGGTAVTGTLHGTANTTYRLEFFANPDGLPQGQVFLGAASETTAGSGNLTFQATLPVTASGHVTATATDPNNNTSVFSRAVGLNVPPPVVTAVTVSPSAAGVTGTLTAAVQGYDAAGDPLTYAYQWFDNGHALAGATSASLALSGIARHGDSLTVQVTPSAGGLHGTAVTSSAFVVADTAPAADAGADQTAVEGDSVSFDGSNSSDVDGDPLTYTWDFGDGVRGTGAQVTHTYAEDGTYLATLTVADGQGLVGQSTTTVQVANTLPVFTLPGNQVLENDQVDSAGSFSDAGDNGWTLTADYGDGTGSQPVAYDANHVFTLQHQYAQDGSYKVTVTATDAAGVTQSDSFLVGVFAAGEIATFDMATLGPGQTTATVAAGGIAATVTRPEGEAGSLTIFVAQYTADPTVTVAGGLVYYDLLVLGATPNDAVTATYQYPASVTGAPVLQYFDASSASWQAVAGSTRVANGYQVDTAHNAIEATFDDTSRPKVTNLTGTVFTITVPTPVATPTTVSPSVALASAASSLSATSAAASAAPASSTAGTVSDTPAAVTAPAPRTASFVSSSQLTLALTPSQDSSVTATSASLSATVSANGGAAAGPASGIQVTMTTTARLTGATAAAGAGEGTAAGAGAEAGEDGRASADAAKPAAAETEQPEKAEGVKSSASQPGFWGSVLEGFKNGETAAPPAPTPATGKQSRLDSLDALFSGGFLADRTPPAWPVEADEEPEQPQAGTPVHALGACVLALAWQVARPEQGTRAGRRKRTPRGEAW